jgi:hypothetical protein
MRKVVDRLNALLPPNAITNVKYLPCEVKTNFTILKEVDTFIEQCVRSKVMKNLKNDDIRSRNGMSENLLTSFNQTIG